MGVKETKPSPEKWDGHNAKRSREWFRRLLTTNFTEQDTHISLNYADKQAACEASSFLPRELFLPAELEEHIRQKAPEFLTRAVESAAKRGFAVEYKAMSTLKAPDCYDCGFCNRLRYLKSEWYCRVFKPDEVPNPCTLYHSRTQAPNCLECESWCLNDPRCMNPRSQWAGLITSPNNYCRFFERRPPGL